jgi:hypothetical protein
MNFQLSDRQRDILIWILAGSGFLLIVLLVVVLVVISNQSNRAGNSPGGAKNVVYGLDRRGVPVRIQSPTDLFPPTYGKFTRKAVSGTLRGQTAAGTFKATYTRDKDTIEINGARDNNYAQAEADLQRGIAQLGVPAQVTTLGTTFGYALIPAATANGQVYLLYFHANWYWSITASNQAALDEFMKVFPY